MTPELPPNPRAEMEAKITAWLLGELSAEEAASVREMIAKDAELERLWDRLSQTLNILRETIATPVGEPPAQPAPLKLSPERREKLLAHFKTIAPKEFARDRRRVFTWPVIMAVAASIALLIVITIPNFIRARTSSQQNFIVNNLRLLDSAKQQWALEQHRSAADVPTMEDLKPYFGHGGAGELPNVAGETYYLGAVGQMPVAQLKNKVVTLPDDVGNLAALNQPGAAPAMAPPSEMPQTAAAPASDQIVLGKLRERRLAESENKPVAVVAPSSIVLPQSGEQQLAQEDGQKKQRIFRMTHSLDSDYGRAIPSDQSSDGMVPPAKAAATAAAASSSGIGSANYYTDRESHQVFADDKERLQAGKSALQTRSQPISPQIGEMSRSGFGGGQPLATSERKETEVRLRAAGVSEADIAEIISPAPSAKKVANSGSLGLGTVSSVETLGNRSAQKDDSEKEQALEKWRALPAPENAGLPAPVATPAPLHGAERLTRSAHEPAHDVNVTLSLPLTPSIGESASLAAAAPAGIPRLNSDGSIEADTSTNSVISITRSLAPTSPAPPVGWSAKLDAAGNSSDAPLAHPALPAPVPQPEVLTRSNAFTTFSVNISDVAFRLAEASLENGVMPEAASMRSEEFINAFDYRDPEPAPGAPIGFAWERAGDPFAHNRDLLRFSIKTAAQGRQGGRPLNLVILLDKSGSMERADRVEIIDNALRVLAKQLQPHDTLSVVVFARTARLFVDGVPGSKAGKIAKELRGLTPEGGTNLEEAMKLAYATALRHYLSNGENRVVLLTDGVANLGNVEPAALKQKVEDNRKQGIALDCFGVGWDGYNDDLLETLSRAGNGRYGFINTPEEAATEFAGKLAGALRVAAADVKVQVEFNPDRVTSYRQIGYAKDQLKKEDFRDNNVKAAQIGAAESGSALYTVEINPAGQGPLGTVHVRFRIPGTTDYQEHEWTLPYTGSAVPLEKARAAMRLAITAAAFSEWLAGSPYAGEVTPDRLLSYLRGVPEVYGADARPKKLEWMIRQAKSISGK